jgi:capsular exopolysaccharide synthesis family protein
MRTPGSIAHLLYPLKKRWYIVVICIAISSVIATRYLYMATPEYQAVATLKIEDSQQGMANSNLYRDFDVFKGNAKVQTEVEVLKSRSLFEKALDRLDFYVEYYQVSELKTEEKYHEAPFRVDFSITDSSFTKQQYKFRYLGGEKFAVNYDFHGTTIEKEGEFGKQICDRGVCITVNKEPNIIKYKTSASLDKNWEFVVYSKNALAAKLQNKDYLVKALDKDVNIIKVYYTHPVAEKASKLVNAVAEAYINQSIIDKQDLAGNTVDFINNQLATVGAELDNARDAIKSYRIKNEIVNIPQETEATYKTLGQLEIQKVDINMQLATLERLSDYLRHNREIKFTGPDLGSIQDGLFSDAVTRLNTKIRERDETIKKYTEESDKVKNIDVDINQQKAFLIESVNNTRRKLLARQDELLLAIDDEKATFNGLPEKESTLQELNRNYFLYEKIYNFLIEKRTEALITRQVDVSFNRVLESAVIPEAQVSPRREVVLGIAAFIGFIIGVVLAYARHYAKPKVSTPEDITYNSTIPVIGHIEKMSKNQPAYKNFTALTTRILMNQPQNKSLVVTVTSTLKGEGKSFVAAQLARTLAAQDKKVILVDLNTYAPKMAEWFDVRGLEGMKDVYMQQSSLQNVIQITNIPHLDVITAGNGENPIGHLIATARTKDIIDELRLHYDAVIVDTPEVGEYIDAIPFMKWSDLNLYVVKADSDRDQLIANAEMVKEEYRLEEVHFVVNAMKEKRNHTGFLSPKKSKSIKSKQNAPQLQNLFMW